MAWFGPHGDCMCCYCRCFGTSMARGRSFLGTPTLKVVISDVPDTYGPFDIFTENFSPSYFRETWSFSGLSSINGTYFTSVPKKTSACIIDWQDSLGTTTKNYSQTVIRRQLQDSSSCTVVATTSNFSTRFLTIARTKLRFDQVVDFTPDGDAGDIIITIGTGGDPVLTIGTPSPTVIGIFGRVILKCKYDYDYTLSEEDNRMIHGISTPTWSAASGEIKFTRAYRTAEKCGFGVEYPVFDNFGTITAELLNL